MNKEKPLTVQFNSRPVMRIELYTKVWHPKKKIKTENVQVSNQLSICRMMGFKMAEIY